MRKDAQSCVVQHNNIISSGAPRPFSSAEKSPYISETQMAKHTRKAHKKSHKKTHKRKMSPGAMAWRKKVMDTYRELKAKNPNAKLGDAMKLAAKRN